MPHIVSISYTPSTVEPKPADRYARIAIERAKLLEGHGIEGDRKGGKGDRHLNFMLAETLEELHAEGFRTGPGEMGEQIVLGGLEGAGPRPGGPLPLGGAAGH